MVEAILNYIVQWLTWITDRIVEWLMNVFNTVVQGIQNFINTVFVELQRIFDSIFEWFAIALERIVLVFETILENISQFVADLWASFEQLTTDVIDSIRAFIEDAWSEVRTAITTILDDAISWLGTVADEVVRLINTGIDSVVSIAEQVRTSVVGWIDEVIQVAIQGYQDMVAGFTLALDTFVGTAGSFIATIESRLSELKIAFADAATSVVAGITETAEDTLGPIRDKVQEIIGQLVPDENASQAQTFVKDAQKLAEGKATPDEFRKFASDYWMKTDFKDGFWAQLFFTIIGVMGGVSLIAQVTGLSAQVMMQDFSKAYPYQLFSPADITQAWRRGFVTEAVAVDTIRKHGFTEENAQIILDLSQQVPQEGDLLLLYHRGLISDDDLDKAFLQKGYTEQYREELKAASFLIPPVSDLITMAVREAFSPEIAERFGQYEDYPPDLTEWSGKQALSEEWSKRYWAAHWALPSPQQGFEMLHRGVIDTPDLDLLLRALDVMPFWRERLTQIAYTPFTRIDIRRMHRVGVLTEADVHRSYKDLGYDEAKAKTMTDFVMLLNAPKTADDEVALKDLSRASIVNFYSDGLLQRDKAVSLLESLGYSSDAALLYLESADMDEERKERKAEVSLTTALAEAGAITFEDAEDRLRKIGLSTEEVNKAIVALLRKQQSKTRIPSRSEAERMTKLGIISGDEYKDFLGLLGYSEKWVDAYVNLSLQAG